MLMTIIAFEACAGEEAYMTSTHNNGSNINVNAGNSVEMGINFSVEQGAQFHAFIEGYSEVRAHRYSLA